MRKPIDLNCIGTIESEVRKLETYTAQLEKKLEEAYQVIREAEEETGNRDLSMFLQSIEQES
jgi:hypothetical protein